MSQTVMAQALKSAGVPTPPQNQRIWTLVRDRKGATAREVIDILKLPAQNVSALLSDMEKRGMVTRTYDMRRVRNASGVYNKQVCVYKVTTDEFELLPRPANKATTHPMTPSQKEALDALLTPTKPEPTPEPQPVKKERDLDAFIDSLNAREAKDLYLKLREIFG